MRKNCLPEKLSLMRKYYQLSLSDIAMRLNVPVTEYMNWENGNTLCDTENLKKIAEIYHVKLQDLVDNKRIVSINYLDKINDSVELMTFRKDAKEVPFQEDVADHIMATSVIVTNVPAELTQTTMSIPANNDHTMTMTAPVDLGETRVMSRDDLQATTVNEIVEDTMETEPVKPGIPKKVWGIAGAVLAGLLLLVLGVTLFSREASVDDIEVSLSNVNRLALGDTYSIYIDPNGELITNGDTLPSLSKFKDIVQVSAWDGHLTGLKKNGRVVCTGSDEGCDVGSWSHITMVASGRNHTVGLTDEGTVVCTGNSAACEVDNWKEVTAVYAGDGITVARTKGNNLLVSGNFDEKKTVAAQTKVKEVAVAEEQIVILTNDGKVNTFAVNGGNANNTASWSNVAHITAGRDFVVGANNNGRMVIASANDDLVREVSTWSGIKYMDAHGGTVIAVNATGDLLGAGDNSYHQYRKAENTPEPSEKARLDKVSNVTFKTTSGGVSISWDRVTSADYYEVRLNTNPETRIKAVGDSCNISSDKLVDGTEYLIRITAYTNDNSLAPGEETTVSYQYVANRVKLKTPGDLTLKQDKTELQIHWNSVEHAKEYLVKLGTYEERVRDTSVTLDISALEDGKKYTVSVTAIPDNTRNFENSDPAVKDFTYDEPVEAVPLAKPTNINSEQDAVNETILRISWDAVEHATKYTVSVNGKNYETDQTTLTVDAGAVGLSDGNTYTVKVTASSSDTKHYTNSSAENSFTYTLTPKPTPTPTPEPTVEPTPEPTEEPTPEPTEEPTPEPTSETEEEPDE